MFQMRFAKREVNQVRFRERRVRYDEISIAVLCSVASRVARDTEPSYLLRCLLSYLICRVSCCDRNNNITASPLHAKMTAPAARPIYTLSVCPRTDLPPTALQPWSARRPRGERVQKAGATGGGATLSTRGATPERCDDACRAYRHHTGTVEGFELCLRGRRRLASPRSRMTAPSTAHATRC